MQCNPHSYLLADAVVYFHRMRAQRLRAKSYPSDLKSVVLSEL